MNLLLVSLVGSLALFAIVFGSILIEDFLVQLALLLGKRRVISIWMYSGWFYQSPWMRLLRAVWKGMITLKKRYVWNLKQIHNQIYRKLKRIQPKAEQGDREALTILYFYYTTQKQVYDLDNNTLTIKTVQQSLDNIVELVKSGV